MRKKETITSNRYEWKFPALRHCVNSPPRDGKSHLHRLLVKDSYNISRVDSENCRSASLFNNIYTWTFIALTLDMHMYTLR